MIYHHIHFNCPSNFLSSSYFYWILCNALLTFHHHLNHFYWNTKQAKVLHNCKYSRLWYRVYGVRIALIFECTFVLLMRYESVNLYENQIVITSRISSALSNAVWILHTISLFLSTLLSGFISYLPQYNSALCTTSKVQRLKKKCCKNVWLKSRMIKGTLNPESSFSAALRLFHVYLNLIIMVKTNSKFYKNFSSSFTCQWVQRSQKLV